MQLKKPQYKFWLIDIDGKAQQNGLPPLAAKRMYFAREIGCSDRSVVAKYELSRRKYLGPTAMDAEIALLMAHQALVKPGKLVYDPFVGTGSILVAAAHYGAFTMVTYRWYLICVEVCRMCLYQPSFSRSLVKDIIMRAV